MIGLEFLQIGSLSDRIPYGLANNLPVEVGILESFSQPRTPALEGVKDEQVKVNCPAILFCVIRCLSAADRGRYAGAGHSLSDTFVKDTRLDFAQRPSSHDREKYGRNEG
jgi:hypothetical protein